MIPTVVQQLAAVRHTLAKTVLPALDPDARFAAEQAGLALASLDWTIDVAESEHRYELVEHADHRELLAGLLALPGAADPAGADGARALLADAASPPDDLASLREQARALKRRAAALFGARTADGADEATVREAERLVLGVARRQTERELSWTRSTGFPGERAPIADVLAAQTVSVGSSLTPGDRNAASSATLADH